MASFLDFLEDAKRKLKQSLNTGVQQTHQFFRPASNRLDVAAQRLQAPDTRFMKVSNFMNTVGREWAVPTAKTLGNVAKIYTKATNPFYYLNKNVRRDVDNMGNFFDLSKGNLFKTTEGYDDTRAGKVAKGIGKTMAFATSEIPQLATGQAIGKAVGAGALRIAPRIFRNVAPYSAIKGGTEFGTYSGLSNLLSGNDVKNSLKEAGRSFAIGSVPIGIAGNMPNFDRGGRLPRIGAGAITGAATAYLTGADPAGGAIMGGLSVAPNLSRNWLVYDADKKANIFQIRHYTDDNTFYSDATGGIAGKIAKNFKELPEEKAKVYLASRKYDKLDDFINSQKDKAGNITKQGKELARRMWEETHGVQPKVLTGKASTQKYDKLVEPKKGLDALRGEAKKYKSAEVRDKTGLKLQDPYTAEYLPTNPDGTITLYHSTTKEGAEKIKQSGIFGSKTEGGDIYFTTNKKGYGGIGKDKDVVLAFNVDPKKVKFDDVYRGELHIKGNNADIGGIKPVKSQSPLIAEARKYKTAEEFVKAQGTPKILSEQFDGIKNITSKSSDVQEIFTHGSYGNKPNPRDIDIAIKLKGSINDSTKLIDEIKDFTRQYAPIKGKDGGFQNAMDITFIDNKGKAFVWDGIEIRPSKFVPIKTKSQLTDIWKESQSLSTNKGTQTLTTNNGLKIDIENPKTQTINVPVGNKSVPIEAKIFEHDGVKLALYNEKPLGGRLYVLADPKTGATISSGLSEAGALMHAKIDNPAYWSKVKEVLSTNKGVGAIEPPKTAGGVVEPNGVQPKVPISQEALSNEAKKEIDENMAKLGFKKGEYTYPKSLNQESSTVGTSQVKEVLPIKTTPLKTDTPPTTPKTETVEQAISRKVRQKSFAKAGGDNSLPSIVEKTATNVKQKVNILDYFRTPDRVMKKIGLGAETETLRKSYDKYLDELPKEIDKVKTWAQQTSKQENKNIFRYLDGQKIQLTDKERTIANEVRGYLKDWADKLGLPKEKRITNYITHIFDKDFIQKEFPEDVAKIIKDRVAGSVYDPFVEKRLGKLGYVEDTWAALDAYVKRATRKYNLDPVLGDISKKAEKLELSQLDYVKKYIDRVNMRPTEMDNLLDNFIKSTPIGYKLGQRPTALLTRAGRQMVYRGTLGLNVSSSLKNLSQGANTYAKLGEKYTAKGYFDLAKNYRSSELQDVGVLRDNFIQDKSIGVYKSAIEKADKGLFSLFETAEKINRGAAYYGAKAKALAEGKTEAEAIEFGKKIVRDTQFTFGSIDTPVKMQPDIVKLVTQFQSFTVKQGEFLGEMISKKEWAGLARWIGSSLLFVYGVGKLFGMEPKDLIPSFRFDTPPTLKAPVELGKYLVGAPNRYGQPTSLKDVGQSFIQYVPGGVQGKKTIEGLQAVDAGETKSGNKLVPIAQSTKNYVRGALFGKYNLPEVQAYRELKDKVTKEVNAFKKSSDSIKPLSDGNYAVRVGDEVKKYDTEKKAQRAVNKEDFKKTGKNIQVIGDEVYRLDKEGNVTVTPKTSYDYSLNTNKMQSAKAKDDYKTWVNIANKQLGILEQQLQDPTLDELEQSDIIEKAEILMRSMQKYASYGGFTKPKSGGGGGGRSGRSPSVTKAITMAKATPGVSKIKATTGSYNSAKSRGKIKVAVAPPSVKIPISKKYTGKQLAQMR